MLYDYDKAGNITVKSKLAYTTGTAYIVDGAITAYGYSSSEWKDRLTSYGGTAISYDSLGNPTNWRGGITDICWDDKKLTTLSKDIFGISMSYNADGIRTRKYCVEQPTLNSVLHQYTLDGTKILKETVTGTKSYTNYYFYDENGSIAGLEYNGVLYYFQKNIQGDIIRICNANGVIVTEYTYDAWGKVLSTTGSLASTVGSRNPFRYRGYYYDDETGLYYLQSRYYDPEVGRFISADAIIGANGDIPGYNLFAYCNNNPVIHSDENGYCMSGDQYFCYQFAAHTLRPGDICPVCHKVVDEVFFAHWNEWSKLAWEHPELSGKEISQMIICGIKTDAAKQKALSSIKGVKKIATVSTFCFVAGTLVKAENEDKPIEEIKEGDYVCRVIQKPEKCRLSKLSGHL